MQHLLARETSTNVESSEQVAHKAALHAEAERLRQEVQTRMGLDEQTVAQLPLWGLRELKADGFVMSAELAEELLP